ncbi:hypothetical protein STRIP9103_07745 [Streptomyces ipomoeae 91-03]|uniref:PE-PGRS family protein n=1 Tax=Streptomyces ipomoeae 91-03 TaxID=698759 RepID=L1KT56_9ACTN|nr:hypothetical protein STRIP9103_07745 [Streptomyces ipomoeae 91-03]
MTGSALRLLIGPTLVVCPQLVEVEPKLVKYTLTEQQADMLRQIAAASSAVPIAPKSSNTAWALEQRGLIKRSWRGSGHVAVVTSDGRYFIKHGKHPKEVQAEQERLAGDAEQAERGPADGAELVARLQSATAGKLTVPDPGPRTRGRWRAAYYDALHHGHVPGELKLRWTGRQRGDCVFTLVDEEAEKAAQPPPVPTIDVPDVLNRPHQLVRATRKALGRSKTVVDTRETPEVISLHVSREQLDRALRIMHALLTEAESRGYQVETRTDLDRGQAVHQMVIVIRGHALPLAITEQTTKVPHEPTAQEIRQQQRNPWTRIPKYDHEFNGRLELGAPARSWYQHSYTYRDSARWTLESRLGRLLHDLEQRAAAAERQQREEELRKAEQRRRWYATVAQARERQVDRHRANILVEQVKALHQANEIRAFCRAARARDDDASAAAEELEWLQWAEAYADRIDPLSAPLATPPDPPASREALRELLQGDLYTHPWPFDSQGRWTLPQEEVAQRP